MKYLITGGHGFLGQHLAQFFSEKNLDFKTTVRQNPDANQIVTGDLNAFNDWPLLFDQVDIVIHAAAKAHDMSKSPGLKDIYNKTNLDLTVRLAEQAKKNGVKKFIFISTIKVNGEFTGNLPFRADDTPQPIDDYGVSKYLAEQALLKLATPGTFDIVIIRPCLIYGAGVKANFANLIKLVQKNWPLPFGALKNRRSFVSVDNLIDLIYQCSLSPQANGQIFLVSDDEDLTLRELILTLAGAQKIKPFLVPVPSWLLRLIFKLIGKSDLSQRLLSSLQVDIEKTKRLLNWKPPYSMNATLKKML